MADEVLKSDAFDNIVIVDPNKIKNSEGFYEDRNIKQENLVMYVNLECNVYPRSRIVSGEERQTILQIAAGTVNFLKPSDKNYLSTDWTEIQSFSSSNNVINSELLGIKSINYKCGASFLPTVDITLEDVRGRALLESGNQSVYSAFFNLPYPTFYLTLKGYYGKAVRYSIILQKFHATFDQSSGNFIITLNFLGYKYNVLTDLQQAYILAVPNMYSQQVNSQIQTESSSEVDASVDQINGSNVTIDSQITQRGYEIIKQVYQEYISKKLLPENFPYLTVQQLVTKLENFEKNVMNKFGSIQINELTDSREYADYLENFKKEILSTQLSTGSWKNTFLDSKNLFIINDGLNSTGGTQQYIVYTFKKEVLEGKNGLTVETALSNLDEKIKKNIEILDNASTFGAKKGTRQNRIKIDIDNKSVETNYNTSNIDIDQTVKFRYGKNPPSGSTDQVITELSTIKTLVDSETQRRISLNKTPIEFSYFFRFDGQGFFSDKIDDAKQKLASKSEFMENSLTEKINAILATDEGIGFEPSIRNIVGVIMASSDAFLRLMEEVHIKASIQSRNPQKKKAVPQDIKNQPDSPVYPWPQFAKDVVTENGVKFELKYPGDTEYIKETGAENYEVWPEVEFVEEFIKGYTQRDQSPLSSNEQNNELSTINRLLISSFDTPSNKPYSVLQNIKFIYEVFERISYISYLEGFSRGGIDVYKTILPLLSNYEATNIIYGLGTDDANLISFFKNKEFQTPEIQDAVNAENPNISTNSVTIESYKKYLFLNSNGGVGQLYQNNIRGNINTKYLQEETENPSKLINEDLPNIFAEITTDNNAAKIEEELVKYLKKYDKNNVEFTDTFPFVFPDWNEYAINEGLKNKSLGKVFDTSKSIFFNEKVKKLTNYEDSNVIDLKGGAIKNRPINYLPNINNYVDFYSLYQDQKNYPITRNIKSTSEDNGKIDDNLTFNEVGLFFTNKNDYGTISILNSTPFIKAIQNGVQNYKDGLNPATSNNIYSQYPYVQAAYLFLNSLPLSDATYQYTNLDDNTKNNYIGPSFKKFGAIHNLPKLWVCRIGSLWHRYKRGEIDKVDFLSSCMGSIDFSNSYDPVNNDQTKVYSFSSSSFTNVIETSLQTQITYNDVNNVITVQQDMNVGFYPKILNDFYYFLFGTNLYNNPTNIESEIQDKILKGDVIIYTNSDSTINKNNGYDVNNLNNGLSYSTRSVLFKNINANSKDSEGLYYFSAPSFGARYSQVNSVCFSSNSLIEPVYNNESVLNGSLRFYWGGSDFGYMPTINSLTPFHTTRIRESKKKSTFLTLNEFNENTISEPISDLFGVFTYDELNIFEQEFLNFSKSSVQSLDGFTLQNILTECLQVKSSDFVANNDNERIQKFQIKQQENYNNSLKQFFNQNVLFQKGNPTNFNYKNFATFTTEPEKFIYGNVDNYTKYTQTPQHVPTSAGTPTLVDSVLQYPNVWSELRTRVGFFDYGGFEYSDTGSYFTDFFPDMNVGFTVENVIRFADLIKIYATKKALAATPETYTANDFKTEITNYMIQLNYLRDNFFGTVMDTLQKNLPSIGKATQSVNESVMTGMQSKLQYYEMFKAINDKWIAGNNFNNDSLFEDILFIDRANRDIGGEVIVDIFEVVKNIKSNPQANVYSIISSIITTNNFIIFSMPAYINFYNVQNVGESPTEDSLEDFGSKLFGMYTEVDYQGSKQKLICQYVDPPSEQLANNDFKNGFNDDSFNLGSPVNNPCLDNLELKQKRDDYGLSNKVVGFWADFGLQNQGVFKNISVSQDSGKPTAESLQSEYDLANTYVGTKAYTQNVSLYNIYKTRSYSSTIEMMGNAMIQPTMYFVLRHIPLFSGSYLITDVEHNITTSSFTTKIIGTRQKLYTPPIKNPLINTIKQNFITKLVNNLATKRQANKRLDSNTIKVKDQISSEINANLTPSPTLICTSMYPTYTAVTPTQMSITVRDMQDTIFDELSNVYTAGTFSYVVYTLFYISSFNNGGFKYYNNNPALVPLGSTYPQWGGNLASLFDSSYICLNDTNNISNAYASFSALTNCVDFIYQKYNSVFNDTLNYIADENNFVDTFARTWIEKYPYDKTANTTDLYQNFKSTNQTEYEDLVDKIRKSYTQINSRF